RNSQATRVALKLTTNELNYSTERLTLINSSGDIAIYKNIPPPESKTILKTWYSTSIVSNGQTSLPTSNNVTLEITDNNGFFEYEVQGFGGCNAFEAEHNLYFSNENEFDIFLFNELQTGECENSAYENLYFSILSDGPNATFSYDLIGDGEALILTNPLGDVLYFSDAPLEFTDLTGSWFLDEIEVDGTIYPNYYSDQDPFEIVFTTNPGLQNYFEFNGTGSCNSFFGNYIPSESNLTLNELNFTLAICNSIPAVTFEQLYFNSVLTFPNSFNFSITGDNDEAILTITNPINGNIARYGRIQNTEVLTRTWFLSRIEQPGEPDIVIPQTDNPTLILSNDLHPTTFLPMTNGFGECNPFLGVYDIALGNGNIIELMDIYVLTGSCPPDYENTYFGILFWSPSSLLEFEIINNGQNLILTDLLGARLIFNDQPLSINEFDITSMDITLAENPVNSVLKLEIPTGVSNNISYRIYDISGKLVSEAKLSSERISVSSLNSGLYFIQFNSDENQSATLKFVKH
ncbi:MAG: META domain-containing protein, partial [Psychroserpens sp.]|nr:META domain-containing protein [Psychroserpens sp.]